MTNKVTKSDFRICSNGLQFSVERHFAIEKGFWHKRTEYEWRPLDSNGLYFYNDRFIYDTLEKARTALDKFYHKAANYHDWQPINPYLE